MGCCASDENGLQGAAIEGGIKKQDAKDASAMGAPKDADPTAGRKKKYSKNPAIQLGYWKIRGLAQPIRYLLEYCEHPYQDVMYEQGDAPNFSIECWTSVKGTLGLDFPSMPYLIDQDTKLTDPFAIMLYLASSYCPETCGKDAEQMGELDMMYSQLKDLKSAITGPCYVG